MISLHLPDCIVGQLAMGQRRLGETGIHEPDAAFLVSHVVGCRIYDLAFYIERKGTLAAVHLDQLMDRPHRFLLTMHRMAQREMFCRCEIYRENY